MTTTTEKGRGRRRIRWLAAICVLFLLPVPWLLFRDAVSSEVRPTSGSSPEFASSSNMPEPPTPSPTARAAERSDSRGGPRGAVRDAEPARDTCDDLKVLVDRTHALPAGYAPDDRVSLRDAGVPVLGPEKMLRRGAARNLARLVASAAHDGEELTVASAYRSYADQEVSHARLVSVYGRDAEKISATPGHSQHQLGTAVDFTNPAVGYEVRRSFGRTTAYEWLRDHAPEYGFVAAYPRGEEAATGFGWEPWHYRYIGVANAREASKEPRGLQGYLMREGVTPRC